MLEQRSAIRPTTGEFGKLRCGTANYDIAVRLKAALIRRDVLVHLRSVLPKFDDLIKSYESDSWYAQFNVAPDGSFISLETTGDKDEKSDDEAEKDEVDSVSTFVTYGPLQSLLRRLMKGGYEAALCKLARESVPGKALSMNLIKDDPLGKALSDIRAKYEQDYPVNVKVDVEPARQVHSGLEVVHRIEISNEDEYKSMLADYNAKATRHEEDAIQVWLSSCFQKIISKPIAT